MADDLAPLIAPMSDGSDPKPPTSLFKYQPVTTRSLGNLSSEVIWLCKPHRFNDPFDCLSRKGVPSFSEPEWEDMYEGERLASEAFRNFPGGSHDEQYLTNGKPNDQFRQMISNRFKGVVERAESVRAGAGVACFSEVSHDLLMWAHYADGHRGFCLEFDAAQDPFNWAHKVSYELLSPFHDSVPSAERTTALSFLDTGFSRKLLTTKHTNWQYEEEWRLLSEEGDRTVIFSFKSLRRVYLGSEMSESDERLVRSVLKSVDVEYRKMRPSFDKFELLDAPA